MLRLCPRSGKVVILNVFKTGISVRHVDAGDAVTSPKLKNWPLFRQKYFQYLGKVCSKIHMQVR